MSQNESVKCWIDCWKSSTEDAVFITDEMQAVLWNKRAEIFGKDTDETRKKKKDNVFFELLDKAGFSPKGATVLDIGCGPGTLSIPLAQAGAEVTSLDISVAMLDRLRDTSEREGLDINPIECSWWTADIDTFGFRNKFDLVIASFTPGIKDVETFDRMMACSKKYCYYSNFIRKDTTKIPNDVYVGIREKSPRDNIFGSGFLYPFMYLYTLGFHPMIKIYRKSQEIKEDCHEAAEKAIDCLEHNHELSDEKRENILEYYKKHSTNGTYNTHSDAYKGTMVWSVDNQGNSARL